MPIEVILNAGSGSVEQESTKQKLTDLFEENDIHAEINLAKNGGEIVKLSKNAAKGNAEIIVTGGGDGTISAFAQEMVGKNKTLGVLPLGTLNHFSKDLNIPQNLEEAVKIIAENHTKLIDAAEVNGQIFINNSSIGLYPQIVRRREQQQERLGRGKWSAAFWAAIAVLRRYPFLLVKLNVGGKQLIRKTPFVFIGNNEYEMDSFHIGGRRHLDAGKLSVYVLHRTGRMGLVRLALRLLFGKLRQAKDFETFCTEAITIETHHKKLLVAFDGEVKQMETPLCYQIHPKALRVIVPK